MLWAEKYRPDNPFQLVGNEEVRLEFIKWLKNWKENSKAALLIGPPGIGKTTLVYACAKFLKYKVLELNASDVRTKGKLEIFLKPGLIYSNLFGEKAFAFLDEVDGIYGKQDYGGLEFLLEALKFSKVPMVFAANKEDERIKKLASHCEVFRMKKIAPRLIEIYLRHVLKREGLEGDDGLIREVVKSCEGDLRSALNNLQLAMANKSTEGLLTPSVQFPLEEGITKFFQAKDIYEAYEILSSIKAEPMDKLRALYNTLIVSELPLDLKLESLKVLSYADELLNRILKTQEWRQLKYLDRLLAFGLNNLLKGYTLSYREDSLSWPLKLRIWNDSKNLRDLALYLSKQFHVSSKDFLAFYLPLMIVLFKKKRLEDMFRALGLTENMIKAINKEAKSLEVD
ncbi:MAG: AAA family ATPase [Nitrososphaerales archaeon]